MEMIDMEFCDLNCLHATWPKDEALDGSSSCRTFQAIYCKKRNRIVHKNAPCQEKEKRLPANGVEVGDHGE
jgi:hypothetical protein